MSHPLSRALRPRAVALVGLLSVLALLPLSALADDGLAIGSTGTLAAGTALRTAPGFDAPAATEVAPGSQVTIADGPLVAADGSLWYQVDVWGQVGYLPTSAVSGAGGEMGAVETPTDVVETMAPDAALTGTEPADPAVEPFEATETLAEPVVPAVLYGAMYIVGTDGDGAACRAEASFDSASLATLPEGSTVEALGVAVGEWQPVACGGGTGYVHGAYMSWDPAAAPMAAEAEPVATEEPVIAAPTEEAAIEDEVAVEDEAVEESVVEEPVVDEALAVESVEERSGGRNGRDVGGQTGGGSGQAIADFAMGFVGYPYVYAGADPSGFDCSGFTMYVVQQTLGMSIPHDTAAQSGVGTPVGKGELQPGDLVFFQNTFAPGVSHAGVYIGGGQFVHAENEATGVKVSDINSSYYSEHWYGGMRLV
ncbi:MAG: NLP/P60 [uncultured Thermomicrobiales bacterium]|uniref:NLP/P60 n=1 Tax=uncultured Thermomicrobiales bacterium TaxID=1645740 RepID=A0A6J4V9J7_9BACT|nr:MAG: NLP/P60 [uncultured Thermomicrobiales bacterium]